MHVFPSSHEGSAKTTYEAAACGLAQITTRESGDALTTAVGSRRITDSRVTRLFHFRTKGLLLQYNSTEKFSASQRTPSTVRSIGILTYISEAAIVPCSLRRQLSFAKGYSLLPGDTDVTDDARIPRQAMVGN